MPNNPFLFSFTHACADATAVRRAPPTGRRVAAFVACIIVGVLAAATPAVPADGGRWRQVAGSERYPMAADYKRSSRFVFEEPVVVTDLVANLDGGGASNGSQQVQFAIYADVA